MNRYMPTLALAIAAIWTPSSVVAEGAGATAGPAPTLSFARLYTDSDGVSHFEDGELQLSIENYSPPAHPMAIRALENTKSATFVLLRKGVFEDWHPVPRRQYAVIVSGQVEVTASDGEKRRFSPGMIVLLEDTTGKGHQTRVVGDADNLTLMIAVGGE